MKKILYFILVVFIVFSYSLYTDFKVREEVAADESKEILQAYPIKSEFVDLDGKVVSTESIFSGHKSVYIHFWATWCPPCDKELPDLISFAKANSNDHFIMVAVNDDLEKVRRKFKDYDLPTNIKVLTDGQNFHSKLFGSYKLPETLQFNKDLSLSKRFKGPQNWGIGANLK